LEDLNISAEDLLSRQLLLTDILLYHVVEGEVLAETVVTLDGESVPTLLAGSEISISIVDGGVVLNDSVNVVATDVMASNGVIHVIDRVLIPADMTLSAETPSEETDTADAESTPEASDEAESTPEATEEAASCASLGGSGTCSDSHPPPPHHRGHGRSHPLADG